MICWLTKGYCKGLTDLFYVYAPPFHVLISYITWITVMHLLLLYHSLIIIACNVVTTPIECCEHMDKWIVNRLSQWTLNSLHSRELGIAFTDIDWNYIRLTSCHWSIPSKDYLNWCMSVPESFAKAIISSLTCTPKCWWTFSLNYLIYLVRCCWVNHYNLGGYLQIQMPLPD